MIRNRMRLQAMQCVISGLPQSREGEFYGEVFQDSDLAKWIEAASYILADHEDAELGALIEKAVDIIEEAQQENGYLDTYFTSGRQDMEWTDLYECHEMYCMGHMMEAAAAYYEATGKRRSLISCAAARTILVNVLARKREKEKVIQGIRRLNLPW